MKKISLFILLVLLWFSPAWGATYYIDYNAANDSANGTSTSTPWKRCPGMTGFAGSYSHSAGDVFTFKGGVTWPDAVFIWTLTGSGSAGNHDTYTVDQAWYTGGSWTQPIFDRGGAYTTGSTFQIAFGDNNYITFNNLKFSNFTHVNGSDHGTYGIGGDSENVLIQYCTFTTNDRIGLYFRNVENATHSNIEIAHCDFSNISVCINIASAATGARFDNISIHDNNFHDLSSAIGGGVHATGMHMYIVPADDSTQGFTNFKVYNNKFYGDWSNGYAGGGGVTTFIEIEGAVRDNTTIVYNNAAYISNATSTVESAYNITCISGFTTTGPLIYNNSVYTSDLADGSVSNCFKLGNSSGTILKGNICRGTGWILYWEGSNAITTLTSDYNSFSDHGNPIYDSSIPVSISWATWQGTYGQDLNSSDGVDPLFTSTTDLSLQSGSPCIDDFPNAQAPTAIFITDILGVSRSQGAAWDLGAYEYLSGGTNPSLVSATIPTAGTSISLLFDEIVNIGLGGNGGWTIDMSGGAGEGMSYTSGDGSTTLVYAITGRAIGIGETGTVDYAQPIDGIEDDDGNDLASIDPPFTVTNNAGDVTVPTLSTVGVALNGTSIIYSYSEAVVCSPTSDCCDAYAVTFSAEGAITQTYASGSGTNTVVCTSNKTIRSGETVTVGLNYTQPTNGIEDTTGNDLANIASKAVTNGSSIAKIWYVDNTLGLDTQDGTSATPWKTIAKVNAAAFPVGSTIYFKKGETWNEQLTVPSSGSAGLPITFVAYGSGALPIINAEDARASAINANSKNYLTFQYLDLRNGTTADLILSSGNSLVEHCETSSGAIGLQVTGTPNIIRYNLVGNDAIGVSDSGGTNAYYYNIFNDQTNDAVVVTSAGSTFYNMVIYSPTDDGFDLQANATIKNVIFEAVGGTDIFENGGTATASNNYASATGDPLFVTPGSDFRLQNSSPARQAGVLVGLLEDYVGYTLRLGGAPSMGAYEYKGGSMTGATP